MSNYFKCIVCNSSHLGIKSQNPDLFTEVFKVYCRVLKIKLEGSMQWDFKDEAIPFCEFCAASVEKVCDLSNQLETIELTVNRILQSTKEKILKNPNWWKTDDNPVYSELHLKRIYNFRLQTVRDLHPRVKLLKINTPPKPNVFRPKAARRRNKRITIYKPSKSKANNSNQDCTTNILGEEVGSHLTGETTISGGKSSFPNKSISDVNDTAQNVNTCLVASIDNQNQDDVFTNNNDTINIIDHNYEVDDILQSPVPNQSIQNLYEGRVLQNYSTPTLEVCPKMEDLSSDMEIQNEDVNEYFPELNGNISIHNKHDPSNSGVINELNIMEKITRADKPIGISKKSLYYYGIEYKWENGSYTCGKCKATMKGRRAVLDHVRKCQNSKAKIFQMPKPNTSYQCEICGLDFNSMDLWNRHKLVEHKATPSVSRPSFVCPYCCKRYLILEEYNQHIQTHSDGRTIFCKEKYCNQRFLSTPELERHKERAHVRKFICNICEVGFKYLRQLKEHCKITHDNASTTNEDEEVLGLQPECFQLSLNTNQCDSQELANIKDNQKFNHTLTEESSETTNSSWSNFQWPQSQNITHNQTIASLKSHLNSKNLLQCGNNSEAAVHVPILKGLLSPSLSFSYGDPKINSVYSTGSSPEVQMQPTTTTTISSDLISTVFISDTFAPTTISERDESLLTLSYLQSEVCEMNCETTEEHQEDVPLSYILPYQSTDDSIVSSDQGFLQDNNPTDSDMFDTPRTHYKSNIDVICIDSDDDSSNTTTQDIGIYTSDQSIHGSGLSLDNSTISSNESFSSVVGRNSRTRALNYSCNICSKLFKDNYSLIVHQRIHTGEKPFSCNVCGKSFRQKPHLMKHYDTHIKYMVN